MLKDLINISTRVLYVYIKEPSIISLLISLYKKYRDFQSEDVLEASTAIEIRKLQAMTRYPPLDGLEWLSCVNVDALEASDIEKVIKGVNSFETCLIYTSDYKLFRNITDVIINKSLPAKSFYAGRFERSDVSFLKTYYLGDRFINEKLLKFVYSEYSHKPEKIIKFFQLLRSGYVFTSDEAIVDELGLGRLQSKNLLLYLMSVKPITSRKFKNAYIKGTKYFKLLLQEYDMPVIYQQILNYLKVMFRLKEEYVKGISMSKYYETLSDTSFYIKSLRYDADQLVTTFTFEDLIFFQQMFINLKYLFYSCNSDFIISDIMIALLNTINKKNIAILH